MKRFEYDITKHPNDNFTHLVYFCSDDGQCNIDQVPLDQTNVLTDILNERGGEGWEMVQTLFGKDGVIIIWKREIQS